MIAEAEHIPETTTLTIVLEGREARNVSEQIDILRSQRIFDSIARDIGLDTLKIFLHTVKTNINKPKTDENGYK